jgi:hypothetical protein
MQHVSEHMLLLLLSFLWYVGLRSSFMYASTVAVASSAIKMSSFLSLLQYVTERTFPRSKLKEFLTDPGGHKNDK